MKIYPNDRLEELNKFSEWALKNFTGNELVKIAIYITERVKEIIAEANNA